MRRILSPGVLIPVVLAIAGLSLIVAGQVMNNPGPASSLPPIAAPSRSGVATDPAVPTATPTPTPLPDDVVAVQLQVTGVGINVPVRQSDSPETDDFPPQDAAFILSGGAQPGRNTNSYIFAHALPHLFKPLWNVQIGDQVLVQMSNGLVLEYVITEVRPNTPCPDANAEPNPDPPLALQRATHCDTSWLNPTDYEVLTLQTSQGFNRNWGELVVIAEPVA